MSVYEKIQSQQEKLSDTEPAWLIGEQLKEICRENPACESILSEDLDSEAMSLKAAAGALKKYADENKKSRASCFCITPKVADQILRKFYGLPEAMPELNQMPGVIDLSAFI